MSIYQDFIKAMQKEFRPFRSGVNGQRYTGLGEDGRLQKDSPAGVVHEGEQVIEADMVEEAGGPARIRRQVEALAAENENLPAEPEVSQGRLPGFRGGTGCGAVRGLRGYQIGTGSGTVGHEITLEPPRKPIIENVSIKPPEEISVAPMTGTKEETDLSGNVLRQSTVTGTPEGTVESGRLIKPDAPQPPKMPTTPDLDKPAQPDPDLDLTGVDTAFRRVEGIAEGESEAARIERERTQQELTAKHEAERQSLNQQMAQEGASQAEINAAQAQLQRDQRSESEKTRTGLAESAAERAERAAVTGAQLELAKTQFVEGHKLDLRRLGIDEKHIDFIDDLTLKQFDENVRQFGEKMALEKFRDTIQQKQFDELRKIDWTRVGIDQQYADQSKEQFDRTMDLEWSKYDLSAEQFNDMSARAWTVIEQNAEQFGMTYALDKLRTDASIQMPLANAAMQAGDFEAAEGIFGQMGYPIDLSAQQSMFNQAEIGQALANLTEDINRMPGASVDEILANDLVKGDLERAWINMHPGEKAEGEAFDTWKRNAVTNARLAQDPFHTAIQSMSDSTVASMMASAGITDPNSYTFGGKRGVDAYKFALTGFMAAGGMSPEDGGWDFGDGSGDLMGGEVEEVTGLNLETGEVVSPTAQTDEVTVEQPKIGPDTPTSIKSGTSSTPQTLSGSGAPTIENNVSTDHVEGSTYTDNSTGDQYEMTKKGWEKTGSTGPAPTNTPSPPTRDASFLWLEDNSDQLTGVNNIDDFMITFERIIDVASEMPATRSEGTHLMDGVDEGKEVEKGVETLLSQVFPWVSTGDKQKIMKNILEGSAATGTDHIVATEHRGDTDLSFDRAAMDMLALSRLLTGGLPFQQSYNVLSNMIGAERVNTSIKAFIGQDLPKGTVSKITN